MNYQEYINYNRIPMIKYLTSDDGTRFGVYDMTIDADLYAGHTYTFECYPIKGHDLPRATYPFEIKKVIYSDPATIVLWTDGTKTVVKCQENDVYDEQTGLLMCIAKKAYGNNGKFNDILRKWEPKFEEETWVDPFSLFSSMVRDAFENQQKLNDLMEENVFMYRKAE